MELYEGGIKVAGYRGTWYCIDRLYDINNDEWFYLLESEIYGDECACLIVDIYNNVILDDVWNGFDDLEVLQ